MIFFDANGRIEGYAATFYDRIDDELGSRFFVPGVFSRAIREYGADAIRVPLLYRHDDRDPVGTVGTMVEDAVGLRIIGHLALATQRGQEVFEMVRQQAVTGFSVGGMFLIKDGRVVDCELKEISLTPDPALHHARVASCDADLAHYDSYDHRVGRLWRDAWKHQLGE